MKSHKVGNENCDACDEGFPKKCVDCGQLVHAQFNFVEWGSTRMFYHCDGCKLSISLVSTEDKISIDINIVEDD